MPSDCGGSIGKREYGFASAGAGTLGGPGLAVAGWLGRVGAVRCGISATGASCRGGLAGAAGLGAAELAGRIRDGLDHRRTLTALAAATLRRVQPFPDVGFKYRTVLALQSVHLTALNLPDKELRLPEFWALDYFKCAQEAERRESGWTMGP